MIDLLEGWRAVNQIWCSSCLGALVDSKQFQTIKLENFSNIHTLSGHLQDFFALFIILNFEKLLNQLDIILN